MQSTQPTVVAPVEVALVGEAVALAVNLLTSALEDIKRCLRHGNGQRAAALEDDFEGGGGDASAMGAVGRHVKHGARRRPERRR